MQNQPQRLNSIELLRGLAALMVCIYHINSRETYQLHYPFLQAIFWKGRLGVQAFFVISGFLVPYMLMKNQTGIFGRAKFFLRRVVRIAGPAIIALVLTLIIWCLREQFLRNQHHIFSKITLTQVLYNITFLAPFTRHSFIIPEFWTLTVELEFYLLMILVFPLAYRNATTFCLFVVLFLSAYYTPLRMLMVVGYSRFFVMGGLAAALFQQKISKELFWVLLAVTFFICWSQATLLEALVGTGSAIFICFAKIGGRFAGWLGHLSYSLYLTHTLVAYTSEIILQRLFPPTSPLNNLLAFLTVLAIVLTFAYFYFKFAEQYFIKLGYRLFASRR